MSFKKVIALILCAVLLCCVFTSCGIDFSSIFEKVQKFDAEHWIDYDNAYSRRKVNNQLVIASNTDTYSEYRILNVKSDGGADYNENIVAIIVQQNSVYVSIGAEGFHHKLAGAKCDVLKEYIKNQIIDVGNAIQEAFLLGNWSEYTEGDSSGVVSEKMETHENAEERIVFYYNLKDEEKFYIGVSKSEYIDGEMRLVMEVQPLESGYWLDFDNAGDITIDEVISSLKDNSAAQDLLKKLCEACGVSINGEILYA
ncbi:MAG: hypothetical protein II399_09730 [Lachnospiraceae bacterium]|nr:hypothetical protein [Lachnospiraceae bacterium]